MFVWNYILLFWWEFANITSAKIFSTYQYKIIVFSKLQTLNPQTYFTFHCKSQNIFTANISGYIYGQARDAMEVM